MGPRLRDRSAPIIYPGRRGEQGCAHDVLGGVRPPSWSAVGWRGPMNKDTRANAITSPQTSFAVPPSFQPRPSFDRTRAPLRRLVAAHPGVAPALARGLRRDDRADVCRGARTHPPPTGAVIATLVGKAVAVRSPSPTVACAGGRRGAHRRLLGSCSRRSGTRPPRRAPPACPGRVRARGQPEADATESLHFGTSVVTSSAAFFSPSSRLAALGTSPAISSIALAHAAAASALARN
jgi:hypothetical protein